MERSCFQRMKVSVQRGRGKEEACMAVCRETGWGIDGVWLCCSSLPEVSGAGKGEALCGVLCSILQKTKFVLLLVPSFFLKF